MQGTKLGLLITLLCASTAPGVAQTTDDVRAAIDRGNAQYMAAFANADATALAGVYDVDGTRLNSNGRMARGHRAIAEDVASFLERAGPVVAVLKTVDLWVHGDLAYETGIRSYTYAPTGENERRIDGRYVTTWKRQRDGGWKMYADMGVPGTSGS